MTQAIVFVFAVEAVEAAEPPAGDCAPPEVLSRQLPRLVVHLLNGDDDRGLRFFPVILRGDEGRRFFVVEELLTPRTLMAMHGQQPAPRFLVDGALRRDALRLRIHEGDSGRVRFDEELPFDARRPLGAVSRVMFELTGVLGWRGAPPAVPALEGSALAHYLVARDRLLELEANLGVAGDEGPAAAARTVLADAAADAEVRQLALDIFSRWAPAAGLGDETAAVLEDACALVDRAGVDRAAALEFHGGVAAILDHCGHPDAALRRYEQIVATAPSKTVAACRAATLHFDAGRPAPARQLLRVVLETGRRDATVLAQLAVCEQALGHHEAHDTLLAELVRQPGLPPPVVRLAVSYLLDHDGVARAVEIAEDCRRRHPREAGAWFDEGRALLAAHRTEPAVEALQTCLTLGPPELLRREVERHLRFASTPALLAEMRAFGAAITRSELKPALRLARRLVRRHPQVPEVWLFLGVARQRLGQNRRAERALRRALAMRADLGEVHDRLGILLIGSRRFREGHEHLSEAVRLLPHEPSPRLHLAQACHYLGLRDAGLEALAEAAKLGGEPDSVAAVQRLFER